MISVPSLRLLQEWRLGHIPHVVCGMGLGIVGLQRKCRFTWSPYRYWSLPAGRYIHGLAAWLVTRIAPANSFQTGRDVIGIISTDAPVHGESMTCPPPT